MKTQLKHFVAKSTQFSQGLVQLEQVEAVKSPKNPLSQSHSGSYLLVGNLHSVQILAAVLH